MALSKFSQAHQQHTEKLATRAENALRPKIRICLYQMGTHLYPQLTSGNVQMFNRGAIWTPKMAKSISYIYPIEIDFQSLFIWYSVQWILFTHIDDIISKNIWPALKSFAIQVKQTLVFAMCVIAREIQKLACLDFIYSANGIINLYKSAHCWKETIYNPEKALIITKN